MRKSMERFAQLLKARAECIWIKTQEEIDVLDDIIEALPDVNDRPLFSSAYKWSLTEGVSKIPLTEGEMAEPPDRSIADPKKLFDYIDAKINTSGARNSIVILRDFHAVIENPKTWRCIRDMKESVEDGMPYCPLIVVSDVVKLPEEVAYLFSVFDYGLPDREMILESVKCANEAAKTHGMEVVDDETVNAAVNACLGMTTRKTDATLMESLVINRKIDPEYLASSKIETVKKSGALDYRIPKTKLSDIGGNELLKAWIKEEIAMFSDDAKKFGIPTPKGFMGVGISGCGKTAIAEAFAGELGVPLLEFSVAKVFDHLVGNTEKKIENALNIAKACAPCVILMDEIEKMLGGIVSSNSSDSGITARVFQSILKFMNEKDNGVYVIMTSNDVAQLPPEFTRAGRLGATWFFDLPDSDERREIYRIHFQKYGKEADDEILDAAITSSENFTGAEIEQSVDVAMRKAFLEWKKSGEKENGEAPSLFKQNVLDANGETIPVYDSSREKIIALRNYCKGRARRTSEESKAHRSSFRGIRPFMEI